MSDRQQEDEQDRRWLGLSPGERKRRQVAALRAEADRLDGRDLVAEARNEASTTLRITELSHPPRVTRDWMIEVSKLLDQLADEVERLRGV